jgi:hypothetical protein
MAQGDEKISVPMWACPFLEDHGPHQKGGHDFVKTEAPVPFNGTIGAPENTFPAGVTTYQVDCLTKFTTQELINMFFSNSQGVAPSGFDATGFYVDVPLDIYPMAYENYFDNEMEQYYYLDNSKKVWVFARVYAPAYLSINNGKNVMYEYIRRIISNRIVGTPKRLFAHHEEVDALVNKSNNRTFVSTYEASSIGSTQTGFLDKLYDVSGLTDAELVSRSELTVTTAEVMSKAITFEALSDLTNPQVTKYQSGSQYRYGIMNVDRDSGKVYSRQITNLTDGNYVSGKQALQTEDNSSLVSVNEQLVFVAGQLRTVSGNFLIEFIPFDTSDPVRTLAIVDPSEFTNTSQPENAAIPVPKVTIGGVEVDGFDDAWIKTSPAQVLGFYVQGEGAVYVLPYYTNTTGSSKFSAKLIKLDNSLGAYLYEDVNIGTWDTKSWADATSAHITSVTRNSTVWNIKYKNITYTARVLGKTAGYTTPDHLFLWQLQDLPLNSSTTLNNDRIQLQQYQLNGIWYVSALYYPDEDDTTVVRAIIIDQGPNPWNWAGDFGINE